MEVGIVLRDVDGEGLGGIEIVFCQGIKSDELDKGIVGEIALSIVVEPVDHRDAVVLNTPDDVHVRYQTAPEREERKKQLGFSRDSE